MQITSRRVRCLTSQPRTASLTEDESDIGWKYVIVGEPLVYLHIEIMSCHFANGYIAKVDD
jgi:hypothetical protein